MLTTLSDYLMVFINIQAYSCGQAAEEIKTYEDFKRSACQMVFLVSDVTDVEIYVKDLNLMLCLIQNAEKTGCENIIIKTDEEDGRTRLSVK